MTDERLSRWLDEGDQPLAPDPRFAAGLRDELRAELGFIQAASVRPIEPDRRWRWSRGGSRLLLVAALIALGAVGLAVITGSVVERLPDRRSELYDQLLRTGSIRIAIRPDHPQVTIPGQPTAGFDNDVALELARTLGLRGDVVLTDASVILSGNADDTWDIALPSVADTSIDSSHFLVSSPYYRWWHRLVVADTATARGPADLAAVPVCAVAGDAGEAWLRGELATTASPPITTQVVTRESDEGCLAALADGEVVGMVTARWSDADLKVRTGLKVVGGPDPESRVVIMRRADEPGRDPTDLLAEINSALEGMHSDGTLTRLSQRRFGGADLTAP